MQLMPEVSRHSGGGSGVRRRRGLVGRAAGCALLVLGAALHACAQEAPAEYVVREPASPEIAAQIEYICASALQLLEQHCPEWSDQQRHVCVEGVRIGFCNGLSRPLPEERVAAFLAGFKTYAERNAAYVIGSGSHAVAPELSMQALKWEMAGKCRAFAERESRDGAEADLEAALQQLPTLTEPVIAAALAEGLAADQAENLREMCLTHWTKMANDPLETGLKRPLSAEEQQQTEQGLQKAWAAAQNVWDKRQEIGRGLEAGRDHVVADAYAVFAGNTIASVTRPPKGAEYEQHLWTVKQIGEQQRLWMDQRMREQRGAFANMFISSTLGPSVETHDRMIFLLSDILMTPGFMSPQSATATCRAEAVLTFEKHAPVVLQLSYIFRAPDQGKMVIDSRFAPKTAIDFFEHKVGMAYALDGGKLAYYNPFLRELHRTDLGAIDADAVVSRVYGTGNAADLDPWLKGLFDLGALRSGDGLRVGTEKIGETKCGVLEFTPAPAPAHILGHAVSRVWTWVDADRDLTLKTVLYAEDGAEVAVTTYDSITEVSPGRWAALVSRTEYADGEVELAQEVTVRHGDGPSQQQVTRGTVPFPARTVIRRYSALGGGLVVPLSIEVRDQEAHLVMYMRFFDYIINSGVPESAFEVPALPAM